MVMNYGYARSGKWDEVKRGIEGVVKAAKKHGVGVKVIFETCELTEEEIRAYVATGEPMDKAGAYGIQGRGALFVAHLDGDYFNVMGLPLCRLGQLLNELGVELL